MIYEVTLNASRCSGCMACAVACMDHHDLPENGVPFRTVMAIEKGAFPLMRLSFAPVACFHCVAAACVDACSRMALARDGAMGVVLVAAEKCVGCGTCAEACPHDAPHFFSRLKMKKCDLCVDRLREGMAPACVHTCPTGALTLVQGGKPVDFHAAADCLE